MKGAVLRQLAILDRAEPDLRRKVLAVCGDVEWHPLSAHVRADGWRLLPYECYRTPERQLVLLREGRTQLAKSLHNVLPARACDVVWWNPTRGWSWSTAMPWRLVGRSARAHGLVWGGDWRTFVDLPHLEMPPER